MSKENRSYAIIVPPTQHCLTRCILVSKSRSKRKQNFSLFSRELKHSKLSLQSNRSSTSDTLNSGLHITWDQFALCGSISKIAKGCSARFQRALQRKHEEPRSGTKNKCGELHFSFAGIMLQNCNHNDPFAPINGVYSSFQPEFALEPLPLQDFIRIPPSRLQSTTFQMDQYGRKSLVFRRKSHKRIL